MEGVKEASMEDVNKKRDDHSEPQEGPLQIQKPLGAEKRELSVGRIEVPETVKEAWKRICESLDEDEIEDETMGSGSDDESMRKFRDYWIDLWGGHYGSFEDTTHIPAARFTDIPPPPHASHCTTLQVFSAKIGKLSGGLQFPLNVFGLIALRDCVEPRRNIIFNRERNDCQTITEVDPDLILTGPSRAAVLLDPLDIEVTLKVKGAVECEDKTLCSKAVQLVCINVTQPRMIYQSLTSNGSTLELTLAFIDFSVEAAISVRVVDGSLPGVFRFTAYSKSNKCVRGRGLKDTDNKMILLLDSRYTTIPVSGDGHVNLSRSVVSVQDTGELIISCASSEDTCGEVVLAAREAGRSSCPLQVGLCTMEITVAWSLISFLE